LIEDDVSRTRLASWWPHHVVLPAETVRGIVNGETVWGFALTLSVAPQTYTLRRDDRDFVVFSFAKPADAWTFAERFGGELLPLAG
jgi:hypothetical protein